MQLFCSWKWGPASSTCTATTEMFLRASVRFRTQILPPYNRCWLCWSRAAYNFYELQVGTTVSSLLCLGTSKYRMYHTTEHALLLYPNSSAYPGACPWVSMQKFPQRGKGSGGKQKAFPSEGSDNKWWDYHRNQQTTASLQIITASLQINLYRSTVKPIPLCIISRCFPTSSA